MVQVIEKGLIIFVVLSILGLLSCCAAVYLVLNYDRISANISAPNPKKVDLSDPELIYDQFSTRAFGISWSEDSSAVEARICNKGSLSTIAAFDLETGTMKVYDKPSEEGETVLAEAFPSEMSGLDENHTVWSVCEDQNMVVSGSSFEGEDYELNLWEDGILIKSFSFSSDQWPSGYYAPTPRSEFSPSCSKFVLVLSGWIATESNGREELWLLDTTSRTFGLAVVGREPKWIDFPAQSVWPSWSPDEKEFVFGGGDFGLEVFDTETSKRRWLVGPKYTLYFPHWSPSGHWIAAEWQNGDYYSVFVISPDGKQMASAGKCDSITIKWAPSGDRLAYRCSDFEEDRDNLWVWELDMVQNYRKLD